ncbi:MULTISPECIES: hypothetical protein [Planktothrix]|uniref:hypothetical protein n=1 Tax=Planktothrix TaxID=54304 RepID=UPI00047D6053|nr:MULTISPECIES: hypothetical protein [Planktothrix]
MSQPPALPTLLALLLAIRDHPDVALNDDKQEELFTIGEQLKRHPEMRDKTHAKLMSVIQSNDKLNESFTKYQTALIRFLATENSENLDYLPTSEEVLETLQAGNEHNQMEKLGPKPKKSKRSPSLTIINDIVVPILKSNNPPEVSKKLFQPLLDKLSQVSADSDKLPRTLPPLF